VAAPAFPAKLAPASTSYRTETAAVGNLIIAGELTDENGTFTRSRNPGSDMLTYGAQQTESTVDDLGSAQLVNGVAQVPLSADFKQTINTQRPYMVFLTTYGDNNGLYIASRTADGFVVREHSGRHSNLSFDYRVVARPYGAQIARLPYESIMHPNRPHASGRAISLATARALTMKRMEAGYRRYEKLKGMRFTSNFIPKAPMSLTLIR
jgi:hypothetical protein